MSHSLTFLDTWQKKSRKCIENDKQQMKFWNDISASESFI